MGRDVLVFREFSVKVDTFYAYELETLVYDGCADLVCCEL